MYITVYSFVTCTNRIFHSDKRRVPNHECKRLPSSAWHQEHKNSNERYNYDEEGIEMQ